MEQFGIWYFFTSSQTHLEYSRTNCKLSSNCRRQYNCHFINVLQHLHLP